MTAQLFFLQKRDGISGPFTREEIISQLKNGSLRLCDQLSQDKKNWSSIFNLLDTILPPKEPVLSEAPASEVAITDIVVDVPLQTQTEIINVVNDDMPLPPIQDILPNPPYILDTTTSGFYSDKSHSMLPKDESLNLTPKTKTPDCSFIRILSDTFASLGNGSCYLQKLWMRGKAAMLISGISAIILSTLAGLAGCMLFSKFYICTFSEIYIRSLVTMFATGLITWIGNLLIRVLASPQETPESNEADFLTAMHSMFNCSMFITVLHALTAALPQINAGNLPWALLLIPGVPAGFFLFNTFVSLRVNFMHTSRLNAFWSTLCAYMELYLILTVVLFILVPAYKFK